MKRLLLQMAYLCGPIDRCPESGKGWRDEITPTLKEMGVIVLNPLEKPSFGIAIESEETDRLRKEYKKEGKYNEFAKIMKPIRNFDLRLVDLASFLIVNYDRELSPTGTLEEMFEANRQKKPILIYCKQGKKDLPDWMFAVLPHIFFFDYWTDLLTYLQIISIIEEEPDTLNRWRFIDLEPLVREVLEIHDKSGA